MCRRQKEWTVAVGVRSVCLSLSGQGVVCDTVVFGLGFMVFGASVMATNQALGLLVGMAVIITLLADFPFLPPLLMVLDGTRKTGQEIRERLRRSIEVG